MSFKYKIMAQLLKSKAKKLTKPTPEVVSILGFSQEIIPKKIHVDTSYGKVVLFIYKPTNEHKKEKLGVYYNIHGGGFIMKHARQDDHICQYLANQLQCIVISPEYDTAPKHPFPIAVNQCFDIYKWILKHESLLGIDISKIAIGGQSAGATLSVGICMRAKDTAIETPKYLILNYPPLDATKKLESKKSPLVKPLVSIDFERMIHTVYAKTEENKTNPLISPMLFKDLNKLPSTLIITAEYDTLLEEGIDFRDLLLKEDVNVVYKEIPEVDHFYTHIGPAKKAKECLDIMVKELKPLYDA